jgi:hypothetical protein
MKGFIKMCLVEMHKTTTTDKYGQVSRSNFTPSLFGDMKDEVESIVKRTKEYYNTLPTEQVMELTRRLLLRTLKLERRVVKH